MDPNYLLKDELEYELECRGIKVKNTAPVLRKLLRELLVADQSEDPPRECKCPYQSEHSITFELEVCSAKLKVLSSYIAEIVGKPDRTLFKRLVARLCHVENRLTLIRHGTEAHGVSRDSLIEQCRQLLDKLESQDDVDEEGNLTPEDKKVLEETLGDLGVKIIKKMESKEDTQEQAEAVQGRKDKVHGHDDRCVSFRQDQWGGEGSAMRGRLFRSSTVEEPTPTRKLVPIYQWGVKFAGTSGMSVNAFLERVFELKDARNATDYDLWLYAIDFFEGDALIWYRANKEYVNNWEDLSILLKRTFQKPFYQEELLAEINSRTQGEDEPVMIYIAMMQNMFKRLPSKLTETEKIHIILKNLQPYFQRSVCRDVFRTIPDLINVLTIIERTKINCDNFHQPRVNKKALEPDLAYRVAASAEPSVHELEERLEIAEIKPSLPTGRCWNCRESGHMFRDCTTPKQRLFCFKCGRFGVTTKDCKCVGNGRGGSSNAAN